MVTPGELKYHTHFFQLFDRQPKVSPGAVRQIERCEEECGRRLPLALREWYSLEDTEELLTFGEDVCGPTPFEEFLSDFASDGAVGRAIEFYGPRRVNTGYQAYVILDGSEDPPVRVDGDEQELPFTDYVLDLGRYKLTEYAP